MAASSRGAGTSFSSSRGPKQQTGNDEVHNIKRTFNTTAFPSSLSLVEERYSDN